MRRNPFDPISHQIIRALAGVLLLLVPGAGVVLGYTQWCLSQPHAVPPSANWYAVAALVVALTPATMLNIYIQKRFAEREPPLHGPFFMICGRCGYDCRFSRERCPECGCSDIVDGY